MSQHLTVIRSKTNWDSWFWQLLIPEHVWCIISFDDDDNPGSLQPACIVVDPGSSQFAVEVRFIEELVDVHDCCILDHVTVEYSDEVPDKERVPIELFSCVTAIKRMLAIYNWRIKTPKQLMRELHSGRWD